MVSLLLLLLIIMRAKKPVYSRMSIQRFLGRARLLFPVGLLSCTFLTHSSFIRNTSVFHSVLLLWTHTLTFYILHFFLLSSFFTMSILVLPAICVGTSSHTLPIFLLFSRCLLLLFRPHMSKTVL